MTDTSTSPRERILEAAQRLFYGAGLHAVGMDDLVREAHVTRTTMYRQFASKEELFEAYLRRRAEIERAAFTELVESVDDPADAVRAIGTALVEHDLAFLWRGCPFINASADFAETDHVIRQIARDHRHWVMELTAQFLQRAGHPDPAAGSRLLMMLRTGAVVGGALDGERDFDADFLAACDRVIAGDWSSR